MEQVQFLPVASFIQVLYVAADIRGTLAHDFSLDRALIQLESAALFSSRSSKARQSRVPQTTVHLQDRSIHSGYVHVPYRKHERDHFRKEAPSTMKKTIACITLACFMATLPGCHTTQEVPRAELFLEEDLSIVEVVTYKGEQYVFKASSGGKYAALRDTTLVGVLESGSVVRIPISEVQRVYASKSNTGLTILAVLAIPVLLIAVIAATKESCPFVYSYDGQHYVFDGEPYGGAICDALERTDWCRLEYLKPVDGQYRLLLTNEVNETQYTDEFKLWVIDHRQGTEVVPDAEGNLYCVRIPAKPISALNGRGTDITPWIIEKDRLFWESDLRAKDPAKTSDRRDTILIKFPKPKGATKAKLVVNGSTTVWGSQMLKRMTELHGQDVPQWYEELKDPANQMILEVWNRREELYKLQVKVGTAGGWATRGILWGGGPFISEDRVVPLDLRQVEGDTLRILLAPPAGFWQLNSFAVDYSEETIPEHQEIAGSSMVGHDGADLAGILSATDKRYYVMPETGQKAALSFPAPPARPGYVRTVFAKVSGYYDLRAKAEGPPQAEVFRRISTEPGYPAGFALQEYMKMKSQLLRAAHSVQGEAR